MDDRIELSLELQYVSDMGYANGEIPVDYTYKWAKMLRALSLLFPSPVINVVDIGGGLSPMQWMLAITGANVTVLDLVF